MKLEGGRLKTPISYYGGKTNLLNKLLPLVPKHKTYTEAFCGGAALFWAKEAVELETINDANGRLMAFYRAVKYRFDDLQKLVALTRSARRWR